MVESSQDEGSRHIWRCDELLEDQCMNIRFESGNISLSVKATERTKARDSNVSYWKFFVASSGTDDDDDDDGIVAIPPQATDEDDLPPLIVIPGGPVPTSQLFWSHEYMLSLKQQACTGRQIFFYDPSPSLKWDYYSRVELPGLLRAWNITKFSLLGHGFGGMVALSYALGHASRVDLQNSDLESLILLSTPSDLPLFYEVLWDPSDGVFGKLPPHVQGRIHDLIHESAYSTPEYQMMARSQDPYWLTRTWPAPDCVLTSWNKGATGRAPGDEIVDTLLGQDHDFILDGSQAILADFNITDSLRNLPNIPILVISGEFDSVRPQVVEVLLEALPNDNIQYFELPNAGNLLTIDQPLLLNNIVSNFMEAVHSGDFPSEVDGGYVLPRVVPTHPQFALAAGPEILLIICLFVPLVLCCVVATHRIRKEWNLRRTYEQLVL